MSNGLKVTAKVTSPENKSAAEIEQELLDKDQAEKDAKAEAARLAEEAKEKPPVEGGENKEPTVEDTPTLELNNDNVLSFINQQTGNSFGSVEEMLKKPEPQQVELSESVAAFQKYHKETGRSIVDFAKLNKDYSKVDPDTLLRNYHADKNPDLDSSEIEFELKEKFGFDEEEDDDNVIQRKRIAKKKQTAEARKYYEDGQEQYKGVLESTTPLVSEDQRENFKQWQQQQSTASDRQELQQKQSQHFMKSTNELFSNDFEGFEYNIGDDKTAKYKIENVEKVKEQQLDTMGFMKKHLDDKGMLKDPRAFHKAMIAANDPDAFFKHAYELGAANAIDKNVKDSKNIKMSPNNASADFSSGKVKAIDHSKGNTRGGLTITPGTKG